MKGFTNLDLGDDHFSDRETALGLGFGDLRVDRLLVIFVRHVVIELLDSLLERVDTLKDAGDRVDVLRGAVESLVTKPFSSFSRQGMQERAELVVREFQ